MGARTVRLSAALSVIWTLLRPSIALGVGDAEGVEDAAVAKSTEAAPADPGPDPSFDWVEIHGFISQGLILTAGNEYLATGSTRGSFEFSEVGLNFTSSVTDDLRVGVQLFAQDLGPRGNYSPKLDWFYLDYHWQDWLGLRTGHLKLPYGLYNEVQDIDSARVPVLLPGSVYPVQTRDIQFAQTGVELYGFVRWPGFGALDYRLFGGTLFIDTDNLPEPGGGVELTIEVPYVAGGRLIWETPLEGLRVGSSLEHLLLETTALVPGVGPVLIETRTWFWVASAEYAAFDLVLSAEYSRWAAEQHSDNEMLSPPLEPTSERAYVMATYRHGPWLQPGAYYSLFFPDTRQREGRENVQHDLAGTLRFDINAHWLLKLEGHFMAGTAGLIDPLQVGPSNIATANRQWGVGLLKATAHF